MSYFTLIISSGGNFCRGVCNRKFKHRTSLKHLYGAWSFTFSKSLHS